LEAVLSGTVTIEYLLKLNALLDMSTAYEQFAQANADKKAGR